MKIKSGLLKEYAAFLSFLARLADLIAIFLAACTAHLIHFGNMHFSAHYIIIVVAVILLVLIIFPLFGIYSSWRGVSIGHEIHRLSLAWGITWIGMALLEVVTHTKHTHSSYWLLLFIVAGWIYLALVRVGLRKLTFFLRKNGLNRRDIVILGAGELGCAVVKKLQDSAWTGLYASGFFDDNLNLQGKTIENVPVIGSLDDLESFIQQHVVDEVWLALPLRAEKKVRDIVRKLGLYPNIMIRFVPDVFSFDLLNQTINEVAGIPVLNLNQSPMVGWNRLIKAIEDRILGIIILILISPLMLTIAAIIKFTSKGPVFFTQQRHGWDGQSIVVYKFRSMYLHNDQEVKQATREDDRITPIGRFLRRTSLDELPQFINVVQGRMSIVGPRPHAIVHNEKYKTLIISYMQRHKVKPGITGWAQVNGWRGETDTLEKMEKRVEYDLYYIENWSLFFDIRIILLTVIRGFINKNAY
ncbi:MAG: undecaprenyl-phosphate glucose phosphotransferase [Gammaproteobacteria bacterium RIFCSPHIGHO2_12_FULL_35_23]|nr:MAG: undecaprenyl-phosphate glucose phosphotransferase [Gammaproteobacteria bacterium RIFCSPHIGHO2_12_FULL_35_23]